MKIMNGVEGIEVRNNEVYKVVDSNFLNDLTVSQTTLNPNKSTNGHSHADKEEVYIFQSGYGDIEIDDKRFSVQEGNCVLLNKGEFHRVHNTSTLHPLEFICVFPGGRA